MGIHAELTARPSRRGWGRKLQADRSIFGICRTVTEPRPQELEDDLDPRPTTTNPGAVTGPDPGQTNDQRGRMGSQGSVARLCREEHQRNQGC